jgi:hypothetical protein
MATSAQQKKMGEIYCLLQLDLGYIYGERESGPNGAKKDFLRKSAAFLRQLGKDLCFTEMRVDTNAGGIAVSGEVTLYGMWSGNNGLSFEITKPYGYLRGLLYREIAHIKDFIGAENQWLPLSIFEDADYERLRGAFLLLKQGEAFRYAA